MISISMKTRCDRKGFTLVEALVALAIMVLVLVVLVRATGTATNTEHVAETYNVAILLARSKFAEVALDGPSSFFEDEGQFDEPYDGFGWHVSASEFVDYPGLHSVAVEITMPGRRTFATTRFMYEGGASVLSETDIFHAD